MKNRIKLVLFETVYRFKMDEMLYEYFTKKFYAEYSAWIRKTHKRHKG